MSFWYLASPYAKYPAGKERAYQDVCREAARLVQAGVPIFAPIAHAHGIAAHGNTDPSSHEVWLPADRPFMDAAVGIVVLKLDGWSRSVGVHHEIGYFAQQNKPVVYMEPGTVPGEVIP